ATLQTFDDKAAFLAATSASSATGPIPNVGESSDSATVGSITFTLGGAGATLLYIGATGTPGDPDWYPARPGNEIAIAGNENFVAQTAAPVYSFGFEIVEPHASAGGFPVNSVYQITLFSGATQVGQFTYAPPNDVLTFIGVWSDTAFN